MSQGVEIASLGLGIGLVFGLLCYLVTNLSPGGMITPGWLALVIVGTPERMLTIAVVTASTWAITLGVRKVMILYGKRLFASVVMIGIFVQMTLLIVLGDAFPGLTSEETLGFIVPGLIAYQLVRQPTGATLLAVGGVTSLAYGIMVSAVLLGFVPETRTGLTRDLAAGPLDIGAWQVLVVAGLAAAFLGGLTLSLRRVRRLAAPPPGLVIAETSTPIAPPPVTMRSDRLEAFLRNVTDPGLAQRLAADLAESDVPDVYLFRRAYLKVRELSPDLDPESAAIALVRDGGLTLAESAVVTGADAITLRRRFETDMDRRGPR